MKILPILLAFSTAVIAHASSASTDAPAASNASDVSGVWQDIVDGKHHIQSGAVCPLIIAAATTLTNQGCHKLAFGHMECDGRAHYVPLESVAIIASERPRGDDVACSYHDVEGRDAIISITRTKPGETSSDLFAANRADLLKQIPDATEVFSRSERLDFFKYQGQGHRHANIGAFRLHAGSTVSTLAIVMDPVGEWAVQVQLLDLTDDASRAVDAATFISMKVTNSIKAARH